MDSELSIRFLLMIPEVLNLYILLSFYITLLIPFTGLCYDTNSL